MPTRSTLDAALKALPELLRPAVERDLDELLAEGGQLPWSDYVDDTDAVKAIALSDYLREQVLRWPDSVREVCASDSLQHATARGDLAQRWRESAADIASEEALQQVLRQFRQREMFRIIWRDLLGWADLQETVETMSDLAETCIQGALDWLYADSCRQWGTPYGPGSRGGRAAPADGRDRHGQAGCARTECLLRY